MEETVILKKNRLVDMYVNQNMSVSDIANSLGTLPQTIHKQLIHFGIPRRSRTEGIRLASHKISQAKLGKPSPLKGKRRPELSGRNNGMWGKHHTKEAREKQQAAWKYERHFTPESRRKMGESRRGEKNHFYGRHWSIEEKETLRAKLTGRHLHPETEIENGQHISPKTEFKKRHLPWNTGKHLPEELKARLSNANKGKHPSMKTRLKLSETHKKLWRDPVFVAEQMRARRIRPTKTELAMSRILTNHFPQFAYNGDSRLGVVLRGLIPDFVNINGAKEVIEVFGDYWHIDDKVQNRWQATEMGRIMAYNSIGFRCLVIWEHELKDEQKVINKTCQFLKVSAK